MMAATQLYVGAQTPFGTITQVSNSVYNALAAVQSKDGGLNTYRLPFLIAHGAKPAAQVAA